ncbi:MAG TPA: hypothetical protein VEU33_15100 [Archangium sp.]|nr:hypothetical protein [Archangium sp.]
MAQPTRQMPSSGQVREEERSDAKARIKAALQVLRKLTQRPRKTQSSGQAQDEEKGSSPSPAIVVSDEEFEAFQEALRKPQKASPALRALFASKRKL